MDKILKSIIMRQIPFLIGGTITGTIMTYYYYVINASSPSYPPFGLVGILYVALSAYLVFIGIYSAAISMAHNNELRRFVEKSVKKEGILGNIGTSEKFLEIEKNVVGATKKLSHKLKYETGIEPALNEGEIKKYVSEVISEIKK